MGTQEPPGRCFPARCGAAWGGYGAAWAAAVPRTGNTAFPVHRPSDISSGANQAPQPWFSRNTRHESRPLCFSRITASLPTISHHFPRFPGISRPPHPPPPIKCPRAVRLSYLMPSVIVVNHNPPIKCPRAVCLSWSAARTAAPRRAARSLLSCALWGGYGAAMARHGRRPSPAPATRPFLFTGRQIFLLERPGPPTMVLTKHETRITAFMLFTNHDSRNMVFLVPPATPRRATPSPTNGFFTRHESRLFLACFDRRVVRNAGY